MMVVALWTATELIAKLRAQNLQMLAAGVDSSCACTPADYMARTPTSMYEPAAPIGPSLKEMCVK